MKPEERPTKRDAFLSFLGEGWVSVHLDARRGGVKVPDELAGNRHLVLQYGRSMPIPIPDLRVDEEGVTATLSFSRVPHQTFIPWSAVYIVACTDGRGVLYDEDVPKDLSLLARPGDAAAEEAGGAVEIEAAAPEDGAAAAEAPQETPRGKRLLRSVPAGPIPNDLGEEPPLPAVRRRKRPTLKIVK
jgi:stringent starvation protein B